MRPARFGGLIAVHNSIPQDIVPANYAILSFDMILLGNAQLWKPVGGIKVDGKLNVAGCTVLKMDELIPAVSVIIGGKNKKRDTRHFILPDCLPKEADSVNGRPKVIPLCGASLGKWQLHTPLHEEPTLICLKAEKVYCQNCVKKLRTMTETAESRPTGRFTHFMLRVLAVDETLLSQLPESSRVMLFGLWDDRNYGDPDYKYCNDCRQGSTLNEYSSRHIA